MQLTVKQLKRLIAEALVSEFNAPSGSLRRTKSTGGRQFKLGKIEDENRELSFSEAEDLFPGSTDAWTEVVPDLFPDFPWDDPLVIKRKTLWFKVGNELRVAFDDMPQVELATWHPDRDDWIELDYVAGN